MNNAYAQYLKSDHWKSLKASKERKAPRRCAICASLKQIHLHHLFYRGWYGEKHEDLRWLCARCHKLAHSLIDAGVIKPNSSKAFNHNSVFVITKTEVKRALGLSNVNMFYPKP